MQINSNYCIILGTTGNTAEDDGSEDLTQSELFEEKLRETIDLATQKSANGKLVKPFFTWLVVVLNSIFSESINSR